MTVQFKANQRFDSTKMRQAINGSEIVFHCHHYASLFSQLADDSEGLEGTRLLAESAQETFYPIFRTYFVENQISSAEDRQSIVEQYFAFVGLGELRLDVREHGASEAEMIHSHVDEGWIKKWSQRKAPVNFIGQGFLAAAFAAIRDEEPRAYRVQETQSIVAGSITSKFIVTRA